MSEERLCDDIKLAQTIAQEVARHGGRVYYVGGCVRDRLLGRESKDVDVEVHNIGVEELHALLSSFGRVETVGASFGIFNLHGHTLDIAVPRREAADVRDIREAPTSDDGIREADDVRTSGTSVREASARAASAREASAREADLALVADPFVGTYAAARRRDLTMNALYEDVLTGEIIDYFGGRDDLAHGIIRHVDSQTFSEDPLRVLRAAQFAARFNMHVAEKTIELCSGLDVSGLPSERVLEELKKAMLKAERPSRFFAELRAMNRLDPWFGEVAALAGVPQNPVYHPEGDVWTHTMMVVDAAATQRTNAENAFGLMLAALCHDFGKALTTTERDGRIVSYGHEVEGVELARTFLDRLGASKHTSAYVCNMVELHMRPNALVAQHARQKSYNKLFDRSVCPKDLLLLSWVDSGGDVGEKHGAANNAACELRRRLEAFEELMARPYVQGRDLLEHGLEPGPLMGETLQYAHKLRLAGVTKEHQLRQSLSYYRAKVRKEERARLFGK